MIRHVVRMLTRPRPREALTRLHVDSGTAVVEVFWLAILLLVPLTYVVLTAGAVQRSAFAVTQAAQQAARAYATAGSDAAGQQRADLAARLAMSDQGVAWNPEAPVITCGSCSYTPGSTFTSEVSVRVPLPLIPSFLCGHRCVAGITVSAHHTQQLGCFIGTGALAASC